MWWYVTKFHQVNITGLGSIRGLTLFTIYHCYRTQSLSESYIIFIVKM